LTDKQPEIPEFTTEFADEQLFHYPLKIDGVEHTVILRPLAEIPMGVLEDAYEAQRKGDDQAQLWGPLKWGAVSDEVRALIRRLPGHGWAKIMDAWQAHGDIQLGESSKLSISSNGDNSEKPSKSISSSRA